MALAAGALASLSQAPFDFFAVGFVSFPVLVWLIDGAAVGGGRLIQRFWPSFATGWWFGLGYFVAGLWWTGNALMVEADAFAWALPLAILGLPAVLALFYGLATLLARCLWSDDLGRVAALAAGFGIAEWLRSILLSGFPWNALGYAATPVPLLMQSMAVTGLFGMSALAVFVFAMPALLAARRHRRTGMAVALILIVAHAGYGYVRLQRAPDDPGETLRVRIVQPSILQDEKWTEGARDRIFATYLALSQDDAGAEGPAPSLIMWPETSVPFILTERPAALSAIGDMLESGQTLLAGAVRTEGGVANEATRYYNSVVAISDQGVIADAVDKTHLVPFGEYLPFESWLARFGMEKLVNLPGVFSAGTERHAMRVGENVTALPFICYEIIFPRLVLDKADEADMLVNVTNDAWFADSPGPYQHFRQAQLRAVEAGLPLARAANNGISGVVDAYGRVVDAFAVDAVGALDVSVPLKKGIDLRIGKPSVNGMIILILLALLALAMALRARLRAN